MRSLIGDALTDKLSLELDGPELEPNTVATTRLLELAATFFALVEANARAQDRPLVITGLEILNKCVALVARPSDVRAAREMAELSRRQILRLEEAPRGTGEKLRRAQEALRLLPPGQVARVQVSAWIKDLSALEPEEILPLDSLLAVRARPIKIGGKNPTARFESALEADFSLQTTQEDARVLGQHLYCLVDIEAKVSRDAEGFITGGRLIRFDPVDNTTDPESAWRKWYSDLQVRETHDA